MVTNIRLTKDLELVKLVLDFIPLSPFSDWGTKTVLDLEVVEETAYPKPVLSEQAFEHSKPHQALH